MSHLHRVLIRILPIVVLWGTASWVPVVETNRTAHIPKNDNINHPYYVLIKIEEGLAQLTVCSGAIIDHTTVLTVAQCKNSFADDDVIIIIAGTTERFGTSVGDKYYIDKFYSNIQFDDHLLINDIAIVKIKGMFMFSKEVQPIAMAGKATRFYPGSKVQVLGSAVTSGILTSVEVKIGDFDICKNYYTLQDVEINSKYHFCAGDLDTDTSSYLSGSLLVKDDILLGLASFGSKNADRHTLPYIFTDITKYRDWISLNSLF